MTNSCHKSLLHDLEAGDSLASARPCRDSARVECPRHILCRRRWQRCSRTVAGIYWLQPSCAHYGRPIIESCCVSSRFG
eukprot:6189844-Pleurochrysis_carterae.AAC.4